jgi:uncharacterized protein YhbP (UPF0306 family)
MAKEIPGEVQDFLAEQKTLTLATSGDGGPWAATLTYVNDGSDVYIWTKPSSQTAGHLDQNPTAAFAIDQYSDDWKQTKGIQGRGSCTVVEGEGIAKAADLFGQKYAQLRPGSTSTIVFYRIEADELEYIDNASGAAGDDFGADFRRQSAFDLPALGGDGTD